MTKIRQSNFELLRIVSMILIVISHFSVHGTYERVDYSTHEQIALDVLRIGGKLGSNLFVMIGSYFLVNKNFKIQRVFTVIFQVWFYGVGILLIASIFLQLSKRRVYQSLIPFPQTYWFATTYVLLLIATPILNHIIHYLGKRGLTYLIATLSFFWIILPSLKLETFGLTNVTWFIFLYLTVGWIKIYLKPNLKKFPWGSIAMITLFLTVGNVFWFHGLSHLMPEKMNDALIQLSQSGLLTVIMSFSIFLFTVQSDVFYSKVVNYISNLIFAVYLIHEHPIMRDIIWKTVDNQQFVGGINMLLKGILIGLLVFCLTVILAIFSEKLMIPIINYLTKVFTQWSNMIANKIYSIESE